MENQLDHLVANEEAILRRLLDAVDAQKKRLAAIKNLPAPVNVNIGNMSAVMAPAPLVAASAVGRVDQLQTEEVKPPRNRNAKGAVRAAILNAVKDGADSTAAIVGAVKSSGIDLSADRVRTQLWNYKKDGLVNSPKEGRFNLSEKGLNFIKSLGL